MLTALPADKVSRKKNHRGARVVKYSNEQRSENMAASISITAPAPRPRLDSVDLLRGLVIVLMALDHAKGHFYFNAASDPHDLALPGTTIPYFLTRWVSHFCAPTFVFLAGTGAFLYGARGKTKGQVAWFLLSRGLWLILLELTVIRFAWFLNIDYRFSVGQVIWAIGWSMVILSGLVFLPVSFTAVFGVGMIAFHNLFDSVRAESWGSFDWAWRILHTGQFFEVTRGHFFAPMYPLIPWIGVLATGYAFGAMMLLDPRKRRWEVFGLGLALTLAFVALRFTNAYGDKVPTAPNSFVAQSSLPSGPWAEHEDAIYTIFSFINCQKYPPSLLFLLMTLGPALMALAWFDREPGFLGRFLIIFGRVPLFFYIVHWYVLKAGFVALMYYNGGNEPNSRQHGLELPLVYAIWIGVVILLYPFCYWFAGVKARSRAAWLSYL